MANLVIYFSQKMILNRKLKTHAIFLGAMAKAFAASVENVKTAKMALQVTIAKLILLQNKKIILKKMILIWEID